MADNEGPEVRWYRGEGGVVWKLELPLTTEMADQVRLGRLVEVPEPKGGEVDTSSQRVAAREPNANEPKSVWMEYAIAHGMSRQDANNTSRNDLIAKFGSKPGEARGLGESSGASVPGDKTEAHDSTRANASNESGNEVGKSVGKGK